MRASLLLLLLLPAMAWAGDELQRATQLVRQMKYEEALQAAERILKTVDAGPEELKSAYQIQGLCLSALGKTDEAVMAFRRLLAIDPNFRLSKNISPKLTPPFYQAAGMSMEHRSVVLLHQPPGKVPSLDGVQLEVTLQDDPLAMVKSIRFRYWPANGEEQQLAVAVKGKGKVAVRLPGGIQGSEVRYLVEATNDVGGVLVRLGDKAKPFVLTVAPVAAVAPPGSVVSTSPKPQPRTDLATKPMDLADKRESDNKNLAAATPWYKTWWFWTVVGVAVAGAATGTAVALAGGGGSGGPYYYSIHVK